MKYSRECANCQQNGGNLPEETYGGSPLAGMSCIIENCKLYNEGYVAVPSRG